MGHHTALLAQFYHRPSKPVEIPKPQITSQLKSQFCPLPLSPYTVAPPPTCPSHEGRSGCQRVTPLSVPIPLIGFSALQCFGCPHLANAHFSYSCHHSASNCSVDMLKCGQDTFCAGFKDKSFVSHWNIFFRAIEADGGVHHGTYHRLNIDSSLKSEIKVCQFGTRHLICEPFPQQVWERILHHLLLPALAHRHPPLPCYCHLRYQVRTFSLSHISIIFGILHFDSDACAQITEIHEAVNPAESAKSQLLDAPCRRWGTGYYPKLISQSMKVVRPETSSCHWY